MSSPTPPERITHVPARTTTIQVPENNRTTQVPDDE